MMQPIRRRWNASFDAFIDWCVDVIVSCRLPTFADIYGSPADTRGSGVRVDLRDGGIRIDPVAAGSTLRHRYALAYNDRRLDPGARRGTDDRYIFVHGGRSALGGAR